MQSLHKVIAEELTWSGWLRRRNVITVFVLDRYARDREHDCKKDEQHYTADHRSKEVAAVL